jgi:periplasmic divalent cation tolerance protein
MGQDTGGHARTTRFVHHVETTVPSLQVARTIAKTLLQERLAACAQWWRLSSRYWWKGKLERADEVLLLFKTSARGARTLVKRLSSLHPYEVPYIALLDVPVVPAYAKWVHEEIQPTRNGQGPRRGQARR